MKFQKRPAFEYRGFTQRKQAAFANRPERQRRSLEAKIPLFADQVDTSNKLSIEQEEELRLQRALNLNQSMRDLDAKHWRGARRMYFALTSELRAQVMQRWNAFTGPRTSTMLNYMVRQANGEYDRIHQRQREESRKMREQIRANAGLQMTLLEQMT